MSKRIKVTPEVLDSMHRHALSDFPNECVGFFYGRSADDGKDVLEYQPLNNSKEGDQRRRFEIDPLDYMKAEKYALEAGKDLLGIYHSHPLHPAKPSEHDLRQAVPFFSYIIASVNESAIEDTTSWQLNDNNEFEQEQLDKH